MPVNSQFHLYNIYEIWTKMEAAVHANTIWLEEDEPLDEACMHEYLIYTDIWKRSYIYLNKKQLSCQIKKTEYNQKEHDLISNLLNENQICKTLSDCIWMHQ